jgi:hypothetical protein
MQGDPPDVATVLPPQKCGLLLVGGFLFSLPSRAQCFGLSPDSLNDTSRIRRRDPVSEWFDT